MTRRALRRRYAILGALHEHGPQYEDGLCTLLRAASGTLYADLGALERDYLIVGEEGAPTVAQPSRRLYRLANADERDRGWRARRTVEDELAARRAGRRAPLARPGHVTREVLT